MSNSRPAPVLGGSYAATLERFARPSVAEAYPSTYRKTGRDRRERNCILRSFRSVPAGASVLDLPCGTGRLTRLLVEHGYIVTGADSSAEMLALAEKNFREFQTSSARPVPDVSFERHDVMSTGFADDQFHAVVCNRLFHHFSEPANRRAALKELRRICRGKITVSFFNSFALDALKSRLSHWIRGTTPLDRIPIPLKEFNADIRAAGLRIESKFATRWGISPMWYLVLRRA